VAQLGIQVSKSSVTDDDEAHGVLHHLQRHPAVLLVLATHQRHGLDRWLHSTIAGKINENTDGATLFIPFGTRGFVSEETGECRLNRILIPVDNDPEPSPALEVAAGLIHALSSATVDIHLLHIGDPAHQPSLRLPGEEKANWIWKNSTGSVLTGILDEAREQNADLIVMTTSGRHGLLDALRGSTTEQVLEHAPCPVLAVHEWSD
jgi:nucleotide-binding universal stress UspA family protein